MELDQLRVEPLYKNMLDMHCFARMLESPTQSYKFYWLEAILTLLPYKDEMTFEEIISEMFWEAWYSVSQYHLRLGPTINGKSENMIEHAVHIIEQDPEIIFPMTRDYFMTLLHKNQLLVKADVTGLIRNVPYRLLSSFMSDVSGNDRIWDQKGKLIAYIEDLNQHVYLPYIVINGPRAEKKIRIHSAWKQVLLDNYSIVKSWIQMKKVRYLQDRNPGVPGIVYKLDDENKNRNLDKIRDLWKAFEHISGNNLIDLYSGKYIQSGKLSIDHFVPWSYITNDELWNLVPMDKDNNSSKGNNLPNWSRFFPKFTIMQYSLYELIFTNDIMRDKFESCKSNHLNALWAVENLYIPGNSKSRFSSILEHNLKPIYESAELQGFTEWRK